ncbi:MAG: SUMF1/EgtB/PvdO family nonheme iron enzyme [Elusimicrobiota bacterium]
MDDDCGRLFPYLLLAVVMIALLPMAASGLYEPLGFDGYWHLSIGMQDRWESFLSRWRQDAHPILYYLVLRAVSSLGHSKLLYRSASIIPGAASVYLLGLAAARLCRNKAVALLAAAAYGFSATMRSIFIDVRAYPLALFFVAAAFYCLVDSLASGVRRNRSLLLFGLFTALAISSEYCAILFLLAIAAALALLCAARPAFRERALEWAGRNRRVASAAFGLPFFAVAVFYEAHMKRMAVSFDYLPEFFWSPGIPRILFVARGLRADLNFMLPVEITSEAAALGTLAVLAPLLWYRGLFRKPAGESDASGLPGLVFLLVLGELIALSLCRLYPFGGFARQQSILFPFFALTAFLLLDELAGFLGDSPRFSWSKPAVLALAAAAIAVNYSAARVGAADGYERPGAAPGRTVKPGRTAAGKAGIRWARIPGGEFIMGADDLGPAARPRHEVRIKPFQMTRTLVTNKQYKACVDAGACTKADSYGYWFEGDSQPVVGVDWNQAKTFAKWAGGRLPTEAEWEYAARSAGRERTYPWGEEEADCRRAVVADCEHEREATAPVCSKPAGDTRQGLCDMAGDAWEWVEDRFHDSYERAPADGGAWEDSGSSRIFRGGSWRGVAVSARSELRGYFAAETRSGSVGFRLAR